jgi:hypothetical protein
LNPETEAHGDPRSCFQPGRLWSLWDMYDFILREFHMTLDVVTKAHHSTANAQEGFLPQDFADKLLPEFEMILEFCNRVDLDHAAHRTEWTLKRLRERAMTWPHLRSDTASIHEGMIDDAKKVFCYHYPPDLVKPLHSIKTDWSKVFKKFRSAADDIRAGVDLYALGHNTASVFHMIRVAEIGLRKLARERRVKITRGKPLEWETFGNIIKALHGKIDEIQKAKNGPKKDAALHFYSTALGHMTAIKDKYRDQIAHVRRTYDAPEALSAMNHVREMMLGLAEKLDESSAKMIQWGLR